MITTITVHIFAADEYRDSFELKIESDEGIAFFDDKVIERILERMPYIYLFNYCFFAKDDDGTTNNKLILRK